MHHIAKRIIEMNTLRSKVYLILKKRFTITSKGAWCNELHKLRAEVFGEDYQSILFPIKLYMIVSEPSFDQEIFWVNDGKSFAINRDLYERQIMDLLFNQTKFKSLQNLLYKYSFETESASNICECPVHLSYKFSVYSHPYFIQGRQDLLPKIKISDQATIPSKCNTSDKTSDEHFLSTLELMCRRDRIGSFYDLPDEIAIANKSLLSRKDSEMSVDTFCCHIHTTGIKTPDTGTDETDCSLVSDEHFLSTLELMCRRDLIGSFHDLLDEIAIANKPLLSRKDSEMSLDTFCCHIHATGIKTPDTGTDY
jgi:hypothetical protein